MIYDCFMLFNELEVLELRLNELHPVVDRFVLVEATMKTRGRLARPCMAESRRRVPATPSGMTRPTRTAFRARHLNLTSRVKSANFTIAQPHPFSARKPWLIRIHPTSSKKLPELNITAPAANPPTNLFATVRTRSDFWAFEPRFFLMSRPGPRLEIGHRSSPEQPRRCIMASNAAATRTKS